MGRLELGTKCTCTGCQERFYDLNRKPAICPKCGAQQPPERPRAVRALPGGSFGSRMQRQRVQAPSIDENVQPEDAADIEADAEATDDGDDDVDVDDADEVDDIDLHSGIDKTVG